MLWVGIWSFVFYHRIHEDTDSTIFVDKHKQHLRSFLNHKEEFKFNFHLSDISDENRQAILCLEDRHFYSHPGVNPLAIIRALAANFRSNRVVSGASTIDMQLAKQYISYNHGLIDKLKQAFNGLWLNVFLSKNEILEKYLGSIPFGGNYVGLSTASYAYFKKPTSSLSLREIVFLMSLPQRPARLSELSKKQWRDLVNRRIDYLASACKSIPPSSIKAARNQYFNISKPRLAQSIHNLAPQLQKWMPRKVIQTNLDLSLQNKVISIIEKYRSPSWAGGIDNIGVIVAEQKTGKIRAAVSNWRPLSHEKAQQMNTLIVPRSVGSTLKPVLVAAAIEKRLITSKSLLLDARFYGKSYDPKNYDYQYSGLVSVERALHRSLNTPFVRLLDTYGIRDYRHLLKRTNLRVNRFLGLEGIIGGVHGSLLDMMEIYRGLSSWGDLKKLQWFDTKVPQVSELFLEPESVEVVTKMMRRNPSLAEQGLSNVAWKTGTSMGFRDAWSIGYDDGLLIGVWLGNLDYRSAHGLSGAKNAQPIMFDLFRSVGSYSAPKVVRTGNHFGKVRICKHSGYRPTPWCPIQEVSVPAGSPIAKQCEFHLHYLMHQESKNLVSPGCSVKGKTVFQSKFIYPKYVQYAYHKMGKPIKKLPDVHPTCRKEQVVKNEAKIISPGNQKTYFTADKKIRIPLIIHGNQSIDHCRLNGVKVNSIHSIEVTQGTHEMNCLDKYSRMIRSRFKIESI